MSVATVDAILIAIAPEFASTLQATREIFINLALAQVGSFSCNETILDLARANLAAHMLTVSTRRGASGQISSETEGSLSRSFGSVSNSRTQGGGNSTGYEVTSYGAEYMRLVNSFVITPVTRQYVGTCES